MVGIYTKTRAACTDTHWNVFTRPSVHVVVGALISEVHKGNSRWKGTNSRFNRCWMEEGVFKRSPSLDIPFPVPIEIFHLESVEV